MIEKKFKKWVNKLSISSVKVVKDFKIGPNESCSQKCLVTTRGLNSGDEKYQYIWAGDVYLLFEELEKLKNN